MSRWLAVVLALALGAGCNDEPLASSPGEAALDGGGGAAPLDAQPPDAQTQDAGPKLRTVERRNPFGNTALEHNTMVDGDFEWTSGYGQHGWRAFGSQGEVALLRETGGLCRSGVMCGVLEREFGLLAMATAPRQKPMLVTLYAKPPEPDCGLTRVSMISCTSSAVFSLASVPSVSDLPAADGWCQHRAIVPAFNQQPCLYVTSNAEPGKRTLLDDASILAADGTGASPLAASTPSAELAARASRDLRWLHEHQRIGRFRPSDP
jgi:hypothetical protein